jgi:lipoprotein NlpI
MTATSQQQTKVVNLADSHVLLLSSASDLFNWFQGAVAGNTAAGDFEAAVSPLDATIAADPFMHQTLVNEWSAFVRSLRDAYGNFGRDVVHSYRADVPDQVRNLALSIAKSNFERVRNSARQLLVNQIEATAGTRA